MTEDKNLVKIGQFYFIYDDPVKFIVEDKTKRGLPVVEISIDDSIGLSAEKGRFYGLEQVCKFADKLENRYKTIMEETCP